MTRRGRLIATAGAASVAALTGAIAVVGYTESVDGRFGPLRPVVVTTAPIEAGRTLSSGAVRRSMQIRRIPSRFVPVGALTDRSGAVGLEAVTDLPPGAYIAYGLLRPPVATSRRDRSRSGAPPGLHPVEVTIQGAGAIARNGGRFDVLVTPLDGRGGAIRTRVVSRSATILARTQADPSRSGATTARVTLAVPRRQAIRLIDAEARGERMTLLAVNGR